MYTCVSVLVGTRSVGCALGRKDGNPKTSLRGTGAVDPGSGATVSHTASRRHTFTQNHGSSSLASVQSSSPVPVLAGWKMQTGETIFPEKVREYLSTAFSVRETGGGASGRADLASVSATMNAQPRLLSTLSPCRFPSNQADLSGGK